MNESSIDSLGLRAALDRVPDAVGGQVEDAPEPTGAEPPDSVVVLADHHELGAAEVLVALARASASAPLLLWSDRENLPAHVGSGDLVVVFARRAATGRAALIELATRSGARVATCEPAGGPEVAGGSGSELVAAGIVRLESEVVTAGLVNQLRNAPEVLAARALRSPDDATRIARRLDRAIVLVGGSGALGRAVASYWRRQINLRAKAPAFVIAGGSTDDLCGFGQHGDMTRQVLSFVELHTGGETPRLQRQVERARPLLDEVIQWRELAEARGGTSVERALDLLMLGDQVALELAAMGGIDPGPTPVLDSFDGI